MAEAKTKSAVTIRDLQIFEDLKQVDEVEREVWGLSDIDTTPLTLIIATKEAGSIWVGAFDGTKLVGFAFGFLGLENSRLDCALPHAGSARTLPKFASCL